MNVTPELAVESPSESPESGRKTETFANADWGTLPVTEAEAEEMKQLAFLFAELEREFGETEDPDLRYAAAFAKQCAMGELAGHAGESPE